MTLLEASRALGPLVGQAVVDQTRAEAARVVLEQMTQLAHRLSYRPDLKEDAVNGLLLKLVSRAASGRTWNVPADDAGVRAWLLCCLRNQCISLLRTQRHEVQPTGDDWVEPPAPDPTDEKAALDEARGVWRQLEDDVLPAAALGLSEEASRNLRRAYDEMRALAMRHTTIDEIVRQDGALGEPRLAATVYQHHHRARQRLLRHVASMERRGQVDRRRAGQLMNAVRYLRRRAL